MKKLVRSLTTALLLAGNTMPVTALAQSTPAAVAPTPVEDGKRVVNGVRYHYLLARGTGPTVVLLHGWGSTSYMWRFVMPRLVAAGYTVLAPDLRGFGATDKPATGYDKANIARDIHELVAALGIGPNVAVFGHDMGGMVAYAYAAQWRGEVTRLAILDVPLPGIAPWNDIIQSKRTWHFRFFDVRDVPEMLIAGHERQFISWFHNSEAVNARAFTDADEETYPRAFSMPGALRGGFEYYRAFPEDAVANAAFAKTKLTIPVLGIGGDQSFAPIIGDHLRHVAIDVRTVSIKDSGHWVAEERPDQVSAVLLDFLGTAR